MQGTAAAGAFPASCPAPTPSARLTTTRALLSHHLHHLHHRHRHRHQGTIRSLVEHQILPNFTSIFLQAEEGAGPGGAALDTWLEGLLAEMQSSIERHLKHVFQNSPQDTGMV